ncbi:hypothetical protein J6590_020013 [Homalodisca vitripennis]|nr:hypothetical protein J6590_020013 [Homalodisca vitripennis]
MRHHPQVLGMKFKKGVKRAEISNAIDNYVSGTVGKDMDEATWKSFFDEVPPFLTQEQRNDWMKELHGVSLASDAFFPFRDNIDRAAQPQKDFISPDSLHFDDRVVNYQAMCNLFC